MARQISSWVFSTNLEPLDQTTENNLGGSFWIQLKNFLVSQVGWTVASSSDGVTFAASDLWGSDLSKVTWGTTGSHSHITLKSPIGIVAGLDGSYLGEQSRLWLTLDMYSNSNRVRSRLHKVAPSGGTVSTVPTSIDSVGDDANYTFFNSTLKLSKFHYRGVSSGQGAGAFIALVTNDSNQGLCSFLSVTPSANVKKIGVNDYAYASTLKQAYASTQTSLITTYLDTNYLGWNHDGTVATATSINPFYLVNNLNKIIGVSQTATNLDANSECQNSKLRLVNTSLNNTNEICDLADMSFSGAEIANFAIDKASPNIEYQYHDGGLGYGMWLPTDIEMVW